MKSIKRKLALLLAAMLICAFPIPALAAGEIEIDLANPTSSSPDVVVDGTAKTITIATETTVKIIGAAYSGDEYSIVSDAPLVSSNTITLYIESGTPTQLESINVDCNLVITGDAGAELFVSTDTDGVNAIGVAGDLTINGNISVYASSDSYVSSGFGISANNLVIDGGANVEGSSRTNLGVQLSGALFMNDGVLEAKSNTFYPTYSIGNLVDSVYDVTDESIVDGINVATFRPRVPRMAQSESVRQDEYLLTQFQTRYFTSEGIEWIAVYTSQYNINADGKQYIISADGKITFAGTVGEAGVKKMVDENSPNSTRCFAIVKTEEGLSVISRPTLSKFGDTQSLSNDLALGAASLSAETVDAQYLEALTETMAKSVEASETGEYILFNGAEIFSSSNTGMLDSAMHEFYTEIVDVWERPFSKGAVSFRNSMSKTETDIQMLESRFNSNYDGLISGVWYFGETQSGKKLTSFLGNPNSVIFTPGVSMANGLKSSYAKYGSMSHISLDGLIYDINKLSLFYHLSLSSHF